MGQEDNPCKILRAEPGKKEYSVYAGVVVVKERALFSRNGSEPGEIQTSSSDGHIIKGTSWQ